jgi:hypothetical protein
MIADLIYRHPERFEGDSRTLNHPEFVRIRGSYASNLSIEGPAGEWEPNFIERRIIWNAIVWRRREAIKKLAYQRLLEPR